MDVTHSGDSSRSELVLVLGGRCIMESHVKLPLFMIEDVKQNLFFSPDKGLCIPILKTYRTEPLGPILVKNFTVLFVLV